MTTTTAMHLNWDIILRHADGSYKMVRMFNPDPVSHALALRHAQDTFRPYAVTDVSPSPVQENQGSHMVELVALHNRHQDAIRAGMLEWEPGSLTSHQLERVLTDALADLWRDCYRQGNPAYQEAQFLQRVRLAARNALGREGVL